LISALISLDGISVQGVPMQIRIEIKNLDKVISALKRSPQKMAKELNDAIKKSIYMIERNAKGRTPVDTGRLRASYETTFAPLVGSISPTAYYAIYVHEGTRYMQARPFLREGIEMGKKSIQDYFEQAVAATLNQIAREGS
jgi:HK97 gp10 family phage protein